MIDKAVEGTRRTESINHILNTLDGVDTKRNNIITIFTTNHIENINKAFLRAGRIDSLIVMGALDENTGHKFLERFAVDHTGKSVLDTKKDYTEAGKSLSGIVPAFASSVIDKAKMYAMYNNRETVTPEDIITASNSFKEHIKVTSENVEPTRAEKITSSLESILGNLGYQDVKQTLDSIYEEVVEVRNAL
jgi:transitional endoplasmic reticulum ATPase